MARSSQINMRTSRGDHTVSLERLDIPGREPRFTVRMSADDPLAYGYDDVATSLDDQSMRRLLAWLTTGEAPVADADLPPLPGWGAAEQTPPTTQP